MRRMPLLVAILVFSCACGSGSSSTQDGAAATPADTTDSALPSIYTALERLDRDARRTRLAEMAAEEGTSLTLYTSMNVDDASVVLGGFEDLYGIEVELYRASASAVLQRVLQEAQAGFAGSDVVAVGSAEMSVIDENGLLEALQSPYVDEIVRSGVYPNWAAVYLNVFVAAWNVDRVPTDAVPETWEQVLTDFPDRLVMEVSDFDWFAALVRDYFVAELGYSEDQAVSLFESAAAHARMIEGHSLMTELTAAGEFDMAASAYQHGVERFQADGAPVSWEPAVEPLVIRPTGIGIQRTTDAPATALLFVDYMLSDAQPILVDLHRTPANQTVEGGVPAQYDSITVDPSIVGDDRGKWESLYERVVSASTEPTG